MTESPNDLSFGPGSDQSITDSFGNVWRLALTGKVTINGVPDLDPAFVSVLAYVNQRVWRQTQQDMKWSSKVHPADIWMPIGGTLQSPLTGGEYYVLNEIQITTQNVLDTVDQLASNFGQSRSALISDISSLLTMAQHQATANQSALLAALQQIADTQTTQAIGFTTADRAMITSGFATIIAALNTISSNQLAANSLLNEGLSELASILANVTTLLNTQLKITAEISQATHEPQAIPPSG